MGGKKVHFNPKPEIRYMVTWQFAYQQSRKGNWCQHSRDRLRFHKRIKDIEKVLAPMLFQKYMLYKAITTIISSKHYV